MRHHLTDVSIRSLKHPIKGDVKYWDISLPSFGVRVTSGSKSFFVMRGKKRQLTTIGKFPEISLADARKEAKRLLVQEPTETRPMTILEAVERYLADCAPRLRPRTLVEYARPLRKAPDMLLTDYKRIHLTSTDPHIIIAYKVFFNWCVAHELVDRNPLAHASVTYGKRERVLTPDEIKTIWHYEDGRYSTIVRLLILTGQRIGEIQALDSSWIDGNTLTIPASIAKNKNSSTIPFNLLTAYHIKKHAYFNGFSKSKARMDRETGVTGYTHHDLRRTFATIHASLGTPVHIIERLLNHQSGSISGVAKIYNRFSYMPEMEKAVLDYEHHIATLVGAKA